MSTPTAPKYPRSYHWPTSPGLQNDDRLTLYPENFIGREIVITNKLDGGNTCLYDGDVFARSTGQPSTNGWMAMAKKYHAWKTMGRPQYFYGEDIAALHSIHYTIPRDKTYYLFNVLWEDYWSHWDAVEWFANEIGVPTVGVEFRGIFNSASELTAWLERTIQTPFALGEREGFVIRNVESFHDDDFEKNLCKYVRKGHVQSDEHWTKNWQWNTLTDD